MWKDWFSCILGLWLLISGIVSGLLGPVNAVIVGLLLIFVGFFILKRWEGMVNGLFGIWMVICGLFPSLITSANFIIVGMVITIISLISIFHAHHPEEIKQKTA